MIRTIIIEDDPMVAQINCQYLQPLGDFQIDGIFNSGAAAQEYLKENEADLAIVDIYMPGMNGIELLRWIRGDHRNLSVIMVTAATEIQTVAEALQLGIVDYLIQAVFVCTVSGGGAEVPAQGRCTQAQPYGQPDHAGPASECRPGKPQF